MSARIHILPEDLCNKIAAGEVVERPASVVKELIENALDAGAGEILVEVKAGGRKLIRVIDDGEGMGREDVLLCLERHATSKIRNDSDLFHLHTLGFRGEALPSIASVSRLVLRSCPAESLEGWEIRAEGGVIRQAAAAGMPRGTQVEVHDLFFNTPARRKFLRRTETELGHIADVVTRQALAHPEVHFLLRHDDRSILEAFRQNGLDERVASLLGRPLLRDLLPLECQGNPELRLHGLISRPEAHRSTTGSMFTFINGRYIRDRIVQHAILEGYRQVLEKGRYPIVALFLQIAPEMVDVNVHPTKHEVRFREQSLVHDFIAAAIRERLRPANWLETAPAVASAKDPAPIVEAVISSAPREGIQEALEAYAGRPEQAKIGNGASPVFHLPDSPPKASGFFSSLQILGQFRRSYILAEEGDDLILIDQHAAHERIGFEKLRRQYWQGAVQRQSLLFPVVVELNYRETAQFSQHLEEMGRLGFEIEPFGLRSFAVKAVPHLLAEVDVPPLVREVAEGLVEIGGSGAVETAVEKVLMLLACHGAVRANHALGTPEIRALLSELDGVDFKAHCPHGRPVIQRLTLGEVERLFRRS